MRRRDVIKSVAGMPLLSNVELPKSGSLNYVYLDSLFQSDYITYKSETSNLGEIYRAKFTHCREEYTVEYTAYSFREDSVDVYDNTEVGCVFKHYLYVPQSPYEAWTLAEIGRKQGLESIKSALDRLELKYEGKVTV